MLPLPVQDGDDGHVAELNTSALATKLVPFQNKLSLVRLILTPIIRPVLPLLKLTLPPMSPAGVPFPALKLLAVYAVPEVGNVTLTLIPAANL